MNKQIKQLAEQSGLEWVEMMQTWLANDAEIERFAELVRADERQKYDELIKIMEIAIHDIGGEWGYDYPTVVDARSEIAAIRARSNT